MILNCSHHTNLRLLTTPWSTRLPYPPNVVSFVKNVYQVQFMGSIYSWRYGVLLEFGPLTRDYTLDSSSPSNYQLPITSQLHKDMKFHANI